MTVPVMNVINRNLPSGQCYSNDDFDGAFPASRTVDLNYATAWRCLTTPTGNANSGTLTQAVYVAFDLSTLPLAQRQMWCLAWYMDTTNGTYDYTLFGSTPSNLPASYTIQLNTAAGGSYPATGWSTVVTVANSTYNSRQHIINAAGANWVQILITAINGSVANNNAAIESIDIYDISSSNADNWLIPGDSITDQGWNHGTLPGIAILINQSLANFPLMQAAGIPGYTADQMVLVLPTWLTLFNGKYVILNLGTNDANEGGVPLADYQANMQTMLTAIINAGFTPIMQKTICYGLTANIQANGPTVNAALAALFAANPQCIQGPDLWAFFQANQSLISGDGIHPTLPDGYAAYQQQWVDALLAGPYASKNVNINHGLRGIWAGLPERIM